MKIYTRTGDTGQTSLFGGGRVAKDHPRVSACGAIDELNAFIGGAVASVRSEGSQEKLELVQHDLFTLGAHLATPREAGGPKGEPRRRPVPDLPPLPEARPSHMETWIDEAESKLAPLTSFILPGGSDGAASLHVCRTVCRRAERAVVAVGESDAAASFALRYLNRLSDLLFVLARLENRVAGIDDIPWRRDAE